MKSKADPFFTTRDNNEKKTGLSESRSEGGFVMILLFKQGVSCLLFSYVIAALVVSH